MPSSNGDDFQDIADESQASPMEEFGMDTPELECAFVEAHEPSSAYGTKALGEPPLLSPAPAIRNALLDATGVAVNQIPLTPKLLYRHFHRHARP